MMSLQFNYRDGNGDFQGIELISYTDISDKFEAPKNVLSSQMWDDITVRAYYYSDCSCSQYSYSPTKYILKCFNLVSC